MEIKPGVSFRGKVQSTSYTYQWMKTLTIRTGPTFFRILAQVKYELDGRNAIIYKHFQLTGISSPLGSSK